MTRFKDVDRMPDFPAIEREILRFWEMERPFEALVERNASGKTWSFVDGPITANNPMGVHHAWGRTFKDIFQRHRAMLGYRQRYQNGFDCQGLWVEVEVEKALGLQSKRDIEGYGLAEFSRKCRERVEKFSKVQTEQSKRLGQWMHWDDSYYTMTDRNIEAIWHFLKTCNEKGWLTRGLRSMPWCTRCGSSLSQHEQTNSYKDVTHTAVFFKLPIVGPAKESLLVWTTTPWTLAANVAAAVHPELDYIKFKPEGSDEVLILAEGAKKNAIRHKGEIVGTVKGAELVGLKYDGPVDVPARADVAKRVIPWTDVGSEEGTGIVHIAPGCGAEDYELSGPNELEVLVPIDENGRYYEPYGELAGKSAHEVADQVFAHLEQRDMLYRTEEYEHRYPICWRCKEELVFRAVEEWFITAEEIRPKLLEQAGTVRWIPDYAGKRMADWLENMGDWCISRKRFWGLPLPFYVSDDGEELYVVGSRAELEELAVEGIDKLQELHRPWIDDVVIKSPVSGNTLRRISEVGDCWLDAGIVFHSTLPYFDDRAAWEEWYPAQFICEMVEQVRLWFYATLFMSVTLEGKAPYREVLTYESVVSEDKTRFSKTGYNIPFDEAVEKMGADVMRWMYAGAPVNRNVRFGYNLGDEVKRKLLTLWNVYAFFVNYANVQEPDKLGETVPQASLTDIDRWILARLQTTTRVCRDRLDNYDTAAMVREIESFVDELSNWYVRLNRKRFSRSDNEKDKTLAFRVLYRTLRTLLALLAPVLPFLTEKIYQNLVRRTEEDAPPSVHLLEYPEPEPALINDTIVEDMKAAMRVAQMGHAARAKAKLKVRQPLREVVIKVEGPALERSVATFSALLQRELNVKAVKLLGELASVQTYVVKPNFKALGRKYGKDMPKVQAAIAAQEHRELARTVLAGREAAIEHEGASYRLAPDELVIETTFAPHLVAIEEGDLVVCLNTKLTADLKSEGLARDAIRQIQVMRKDFNYRLGDKIAVQLVGAGPEVTDAVNKYKDDLVKEVQAEAVELVESPSYPDVREVTLGDEALTVAIVRRF